MPLPHYLGGSSYKEPLYKNLFEVTINSEDINPSESLELNLIITKINKNTISFNPNDDFKILKTLLKINTFDMYIKPHKKDGTIYSILSYEGCSFKNIELEILDFDFSSDDLVAFDIKFDYKKFEFYDNLTQYERIEKLKRIID